MRRALAAPDARAVFAQHNQGIRKLFSMWGALSVQARSRAAMRDLPPLSPAPSRARSSSPRARRARALGRR